MRPCSTTWAKSEQLVRLRVISQPLHVVQRYVRAMKIFTGPATTTSDVATTRKKAPRYGPRIGWGILTVCLSIFSVACLGSLVVVATVKNADALSTVALALAVISFAAQLIVPLVQGHSTAQLNAETQAALTGIRTAADSLLTKQSGQFETMLNPHPWPRLNSAARGRLIQCQRSGKLDSRTASSRITGGTDSASNPNAGIVRNHSLTNTVNAVFARLTATQRCGPPPNAQ